MTEGRRYALVHTSHLNAWSVVEGCHDLGIDVFSTDTTGAFPIDTVPAGPRPRPYAEVFTEEHSLRRFLLGRPDMVVGYPRDFPMELLDDKAAMSSWLLEQGERPIRFSLDPAADLFPKFIKCRHSWVEGTNRPRGWVCRTAADESSAFSEMKDSCWTTDHYFAQAWLGDDPTRVYSVCGFFDTDRPQRNQLTVTTKVAGYTDGPGSSSMVATVPDPADLVARTEAILEGLGYAGPFELEFLEQDDAYSIIELNPRFWLQHGLFHAAGNGLLKRYLELDGPEDWSGAPPTALLWVDSLWTLTRLSRGDTGPLSTIRSWRRRGYRLVLTPSVPVLLFRLGPRLLLRRLHGLRTLARS